MPQTRPNTWQSASAGRTLYFPEMCQICRLAARDSFPGMAPCGPLYSQGRSLWRPACNSAFTKSVFQLIGHWLADEICVCTYSRVCNFFGTLACKGRGAGNNAVSSARGKMAMQDECSRTVGGLIDWCANALADAGVFCGHGTETYRDESASLVFHVAGLDHTGETESYSLPIDSHQFRRIADLLRIRIERRIPMPYVLNEAWFAGLKFFVDERVLIPRSPFAELIQAGFEPWTGGARVSRILEIGTGSGCIAIACAVAFPDSEVVATDLSSAALEVARINVARHGLARRIQLLQADLMRGVSGRFDLIVSNPPYVPEGEVAMLPPEYQHEPGMALTSGPDGLASVRRILQDAADHLTPDGTLAVEVGAGRQALELAFGGLPFVWPEFEFGGEGIAVLRAVDLRAAD